MNKTVFFSFGLSLCPTKPLYLFQEGYWNVVRTVVVEGSSADEERIKIEWAGICTLQNPRAMCILHLHLNFRKDGYELAPPNLMSFIS